MCRTRANSEISPEPYTDSQQSFRSHEGIPSYTFLLCRSWWRRKARLYLAFFTVVGKAVAFFILWHSSKRRDRHVPDAVRYRQRWLLSDDPLLKIFSRLVLVCITAVLWDENIVFTCFYCFVRALHEYLMTNVECPFTVSKYRCSKVLYVCTSLKTELNVLSVMVSQIETTFSHCLSSGHDNFDRLIVQNS